MINASKFSSSRRKETTGTPACTRADRIFASTSELLCADNKNKLDDETRLQYTRIARDKAKRLQQLIEELFGLTKMSYGRMAVHLSKIDIAKLMEQMIDEFYPVFEEKHLECDFRTDVNSLIIDADGDLIARLFENLINNATKYGADGKMLLSKRVTF